MPRPAAIFNSRMGSLGLVGTRVPSMLSAPVPWVSTFWATVGWSQGLRRSHQSSLAGLSPVPHPSHCLAASVAGAVTGRVSMAGSQPPNPSDLVMFRGFVCPGYTLDPVTSRVAPAILSMALEMSWDLGKPSEFSEVILSLTSQPAFSHAIAVQWLVRGKPHTSACPPGLVTRRHSLAISVIQAIQASRPPRSESNFFPMKLIPHGGSVTTASTESDGMVGRTFSSSPSTTWCLDSPDRTFSMLIPCPSPWP